MLSKNRIKLLNSLQKKKFRLQHRLFVAEGIKVIKEFLKSSYVLESLYTTTDLFMLPAEKTVFITPDELKKISALTTPQVAVAVFQMPNEASPMPTHFSVALDGVRDPGNLGTIIRLCDWFGIKQLICSLDTVDCYNPKVVQATMGSLARVQVSYVDLASYIASQKVPVYAAFMDGDSIYEKGFSVPEGILVLGNEANGISVEVENHITQRVSIPQFGRVHETESLNVATATAIFLSEYRRMHA